MPRNPFLALFVAAALSIALAACGGGGGGSPDGAITAGAQPSASGPAALTGGAQAGLSWSRPAGQAANTWHWTATNPSGSVMVATSIPGDVYLSSDKGQTWTAQAGLPPAALWISADLSDDGQLIVAVSLNGGMYRSRDGGASWSRIDTAFNAAELLDYESVSVSADGTHIVAAVAGGGIWMSANGTADAPSFAQATLVGGGVLTSWWRAIASDASGTRVVAASHNGDAWVSNDGGASFAPLPVSVDGMAIQDGWYRIALSRDGTTLAMVGNAEYGIGVPGAPRSSGLYVGHFAGGNWSFARASNVAGNYSRVTIAANAPVIAATMSGPAGRALISSDNGASFAALATPAGETVWRSIALTGDASRALLAAGTFFGAPGSLYVSSGPLAP